MDLLEPVANVGAPVAHRAADLEAVRSGAEVSPVAEGGDGDADEVGDLVDGVEVVVRVGVAEIGGVGSPS